MCSVWKPNKMIENTKNSGWNLLELLNALQQTHKTNIKETKKNKGKRKKLSTTQNTHAQKNDEKTKKEQWRMEAKNFKTKTKQIGKGQNK